MDGSTLAVDDDESLRIPEGPKVMPLEDAEPVKLLSVAVSDASDVVVGKTITAGTPPDEAMELEVSSTVEFEARLVVAEAAAVVLGVSVGET